MFCLSSISPFQLVVVGSIIALLVSQETDADELNVIGNFVVAVGGIILAIAAQKEFINSAQETKQPKKDIKNQIKALVDKLPQ